MAHTAAATRRRSPARCGQGAGCRARPGRPRGQAMPSASCAVTGLSTATACGDGSGGIGGGVAADPPTTPGAVPQRFGGDGRTTPSPGQWAHTPRRAAAWLEKLPPGRHAAQQVGMEAGHHVRAALWRRSAGRVLGASWKSSPCSISATPRARMMAFFSTELPCGTTMVQATLRGRAPAAHALAVVAARGADHFTRQRAAPASW